MYKLDDTISRTLASGIARTNESREIEQNSLLLQSFRKIDETRNRYVLTEFELDALDCEE